MPALRCPECDAEVQTAGVRVTDEGATGNLEWQPMREQTICPACGAALVREMSPPTDRWHLGEVSEPGGKPPS